MKSGLYYPDRFMRITLQAMEEVIGSSGMKTIFTRSHLDYLANEPLPDTLERAFDFADISTLFATLREIMGDRGAHMLAHRAGRLTFTQGMGFFTKGVTHDTELENRPAESVPMHIHLNRLANFFNSISDQVCTVEPYENPGTCLFSIQVCPLCIGQSSSQPVCGFFEGLLSEAASVFSAESEYSVKEIECMAAGGIQCKFEITGAD